MSAARYNSMAGLAANPWSTPALKDYESGRCVYDSETITGLNRIPVDKLAGYALAGAVFTSAERLPLSPEEITLALLIDGSWLEADGVHQTNIHAANASTIEQCIPPMDTMHQEITRIWQHGLDGWVIQDFVNGQPAGEPGFAPDSAVRHHHNPLSPTGVLLPASKTFARLEEIAELIRNAQRGPGAKTAIPGYVRNRNLVEQDLMSDKPFVFTGTEQPLDRMTSTAVVDQLVAEAVRLQPQYYQLTHYVDTTGNVQRPSGTDRQLVLGPMFRYVDYIRRQMSAVLALYGASWVYERIHTTDITERAQQLDLYERQLALRVIDQGTFDKQAGEL